MEPLLLLTLLPVAVALIGFLRVVDQPRVLAYRKRERLAAAAALRESEDALVRWHQAWDDAYYSDAETDAAEACRIADLAVARKETPKADPKPYGASLSPVPAERQPDALERQREALVVGILDRLNRHLPVDIPPAVRVHVAAALTARSPLAGQHQHDFLMRHQPTPPLLAGWKAGYPVYGSPANDPVVVVRAKLPIIGWGSDGQPIYETVDSAMQEDFQQAVLSQIMRDRTIEYHSPPGGSPQELAALNQARLARGAQRLVWDKRWNEKYRRDIAAAEVQRKLLEGLSRSEDEAEQSREQESREERDGH